MHGERRARTAPHAHAREVHADLRSARPWCEREREQLTRHGFRGKAVPRVDAALATFAEKDACTIRALAQPPTPRDRHPEWLAQFGIPSLRLHALEVVAPKLDREIAAAIAATVAAVSLLGHARHQHGKSHVSA